VYFAANRHLDINVQAALHGIRYMEAKWLIDNLNFHYKKRHQHTFFDGFLDFFLMLFIHV